MLRAEDHVRIQKGGEINSPPYQIRNAAEVPDFGRFLIILLGNKLIDDVADLLGWCRFRSGEL